MEKLEIMATLKQIFEDRYKVNLQEHGEEILDRQFFDQPFGLYPIDLLYFFFDIEQKLGIQIPQSDVAAGKFATLNHVASVVQSQLLEEVG